MAKSDYVCKICKKVKGSSLFSTPKRYNCPHHGVICGDHIYGMFSDNCTVCKSKVIRYEFNSTNRRYQKA